jgi:DNA primase small subunit
MSLEEITSITQQPIPMAMGSDQEFMRGWFQRYYQKYPPNPPGRLERREFGFMFFDREYVQRHLGFGEAGQLHSYLQGQVPSHSYYSSAYYQFPGAPTMEEKKWMGADLIFDLDADHVKGAEALSYADMLARIKVELLRLVDDFLTGDLGFDASDLRIVFSGGRGYHIHVSDARLVSLRSHERREIVDYIAGTDLNMEWMFPDKVITSAKIKEHLLESKVRLVPPEGSGGWKGRMRIGIQWLVEEMRGRDLADLKTLFPTLSGEKDEVIVKMLQALYDKSGPSEGWQRMLTKDRMECFTAGSPQESLFLRLLENEVRPRFSAEIDEPVTSDIKRLIRLPYSLHGKTGLRVTPVDREDLEDFDPLVDAVPEIYPDRTVEVFVRKPTEITIKGRRFDVSGRCEVPVYAAMFLIGRRIATLDLPPES